MSRSPGHRQFPDHQVREVPLDVSVRAEAPNVKVAESQQVIRVDEDGSPSRYYFPRDDVDFDRLTPSATTSQCPFKGTASYFHLRLDDELVRDAAWSYEDPFDEHAALKERIAFYTERAPQLSVKEVEPH